MNFIRLSINILMNMYAQLRQSSMFDGIKSKYLLFRNPKIEISFSEGKRGSFKYRDLIRFKHFQDTLGRSNSEISFSDFKLCYFERVIAFRNGLGYLEEQDYPYEYLMHKSFLIVYEKLTQTKFDAVNHMVAEVISGPNSFSDEMIQIYRKFEMYMKYKVVKEFEVKQFCKASISLQITFEYMHARLYIKYILSNGEKPLADLSNVKIINIEISSVCQVVVPESTYTMIFYLMDNFIERVHLCYRKTPIYVKVFNLPDHDRSFVNKMYWYLKDRNDSYKVVEKVSRLHPQNISFLKVFLCINLEVKVLKNINKIESNENIFGYSIEKHYFIANEDL